MASSAVHESTTTGGRPAGGRTKVAGFALGAFAATIGVSTAVLGVEIPSVVLVFACVFTVLGIGIGRIATLKLRPLDLAAVSYVALRFVTEAVAATTLGHAANFAGLSSSLYVLAGYICARIAVQSASEFRAFIGGFTLPSLVVSVLAVVQISATGEATRWILAITNSAGAQSRFDDGRLSRATSLIGHWSGLGGYLFCIVAMCGIAMVIDRQVGRISKTMAVCFTSALIASAATFTFAVIIVSFALAVVVLSSLGYRVRGLIAIGVVGSSAWLLFGDSFVARLDQQATSTAYLSAEYAWLPATLSVRIYYWLTQGLPAFAEQPIWGWGHSVYSSHSTWPIRPSTIAWPYPESEYVKALVTGGVVEFIALFALITVALIWARRSDIALGPGARRILVALVICVAISSIINPYMTNPGLPGAWWPLLGALGWINSSSSRISADPQVARGEPR